MNLNSLTPPMTRLLKRLDAGDSLGRAQRTAKVRDTQLAEWSRHAGFRKQLAAHVEAARLRRDAALAQAAADAAEALALAAAGVEDLSAARVKACVEVIKLVPNPDPQDVKIPAADDVSQDEQQTLVNAIRGTTSDDDS
jgi:hypothetical protein